MRLAVALLSVFALAFVASAAADAPEEFAILDVFPDVNPCTGEAMTVTFVGTGFLHVHGDRVAVRAERTITTSDGFAGHGTDSFVDNGQTVKFRQSDIVTNASTGDRFRAQSLFVVDLSTDTVRVERSGLTCLGA
jgi:hypothetical protein